MKHLHPAAIAAALLLLTACSPGDPPRTRSTAEPTAPSPTPAAPVGAVSPQRAPIPAAAPAKGGDAGGIGDDIEPDAIRSESLAQPLVPSPQPEAPHSQKK
jgi:hypothetical protein